MDGVEPLVARARGPLGRRVRLRMLVAFIPLVVLAAPPIPALEPRAERPAYSVGEQWLLKDGVYELTKIEKNRYVWASSAGRQIHLTKDLALASVLKDRIWEWDVTPVPEIAWPLEVGKWGLTHRATLRMRSQPSGIPVRLSWQVKVYEDVRVVGGALYVMYYNIGAVEKFNLSTHASMGAFVPEGSGGLFTPQSFDWGPDGNLYIGSGFLVKQQDADGAWQIGLPNTLGSPATYGTPLATYMALKTLKHAGMPKASEAILKAEGWLRQAQPNNVLAAAALLLASALDPNGSSPRRQEECLNLIRLAQTREGGWGPYADAPAEPFDTAVALLALAELQDAPGIVELIQRGRIFLAAQQNTDGGWPATTRPPRGDSYAQRLSTTGWATLALLATRQ
jgi:hypothetical protein